MGFNFGKYSLDLELRGLPFLKKTLNPNLTIFVKSKDIGAYLLG
jgi:hypothetical protein